MFSAAASPATISTAARLRTAYSSATADPRVLLMLDSIVDCSAVTLAVLLPLTPAPTRPASTTATRTPRRFRSRAVVRPVMPPPSTSTSNERSSVGGG